jgi:glutamine amidotransferase
MCRLYAFTANEPTRVECSLVHAQNALMEQSRGDMEGLVHGHGWGVADFPDGVPMVEKQTWAAYHGEHFRKTAARVYAKTVVAHVRRATVGEPSIQNTHPFHNGRWIFAHNGTVPNFSRVRDLMLEHIDHFYLDEIHGTTDSEHVFYYLLTLWRHNPDMPMLNLVRDGLAQIVKWSREIDPDARIGLNIVLTDGQTMVGSRLGRTLWHLERERIFDCPICGRPHVHHEVGAEYRAVEIASEAITDENWQEMPDGTVYEVDENFYLVTKPIPTAMSGARAS